MTTIASNLGLAAHRLGDSERALKLFSELLEAARVAENRPHFLIALMNIAYVLNELGDHWAAIPLFQKGLNLAHAIGRLDRQVEIMGNLAYAYYLMEQYAEARQAFDIHLALAEELGSRDEQRRAQHGIGLCLIASGEPANAVKVAREEVQRARAAGDTYAQASAHSILGRAQYKLQDLDGAARNLAIAARLYGEAGNGSDQEMAEAMAAQARNELNEGRTERMKAMREASNVDDQLEQSGEQFSLEQNASLLLLCGHLYFEAQHYIPACARLEQALQIGRQGNLKDIVFESLDELVATCGRLKEWASMRLYGEELLALALQIHKKEDCLQLYSNLSLAYSQLEQREHARAMLLEALHITHQHQLIEPYLHFICCLGRLELDRKELGAALEAAELALQTSRRVGVTIELAALHLHCSKALAASDRRSDAINYAQTAEQLYRRLGGDDAATVASRLATAFHFCIPASI